MEKYSFNWAGGYSLSIAEPSSYRYIQLRIMFGIHSKSWVITFCTDNKIYCYSLAKDKKLLYKDGKRFIDSKFLACYFSKSKKMQDIYWKWNNTFLNIDINSISDKELFKQYHQLQAILQKIFCFFDLSRPEYQGYLEEELRKQLNKSFGNENHLNTLLLTTEPDELTLANHNLKNLLQSNPSKQEIQQFIEDNQWIFPGVKNKRDLISYLRQKSNDIGPNRNIQDFKKRRMLQQKILTRAKNKRLEKAILVMQDLSLERTRQKKTWMSARHDISIIIREVARRKGVDEECINGKYLEDDVKHLLFYGKKLDNTEIKNRDNYAMIFSGNGVKFFSGDKARNIFLSVLEEQKVSSSVKGMVAFPGKIRGRIVFVPNADLASLKLSDNKFQKGDILLTQMTQPNMLMLAERSSAIITDEGGLTSHASVIAREFRIPCIVGTGNATRIFKTGDIVEVDAFKGIVMKVDCLDKETHSRK